MKTVSDKRLLRLSTYVCIGLMSLSLGGCQPPSECDPATTLNDLEEQLTRQVRMHRRRHRMFIGPHPGRQVDADAAKRLRCRPGLT